MLILPILPLTSLCILTLIPSLNLGIIIFPSSSLPNCGIVKVFLCFLDLNFGNCALPLKKFRKAVSKERKAN